MALDKTALGSLIKANLDTLSDEEKRDDIKVWTEVADAIVTHITSMAEVNTNVNTVVTIPVLALHLHRVREQVLELELEL